MSVEAKVKGDKKTKSSSFRFVNTHLESFGDPQIREDQARELFADGGPLDTSKQLDLPGRHQLGRPEGQGRHRIHNTPVTKGPTTPSSTIPG